MARRRLRMYPTDFGNSSYCHQIPLEEIQIAWESLERILHHVDYHGIFSAEFKRDARDGTLKILEVNTRVWAMVALANLCGIDTCYLAYCDALALPLPKMELRRHGAAFADVYSDYRYVRKLSRSARPGWLRMVRDWTVAQKPVFSPCAPLQS